jgi:lipopolysaccharide/colanic/teichoic acid biosynthesis glycosyltransferase
MHNLSLDQQMFDKFQEKDSLRVIYIGNLRRDLYQELGKYNYEILFFNLSFPADVWLKYNALASSKLPDAIICDLELPDTDAIALFNSLKSNAQLAKIPFLVLSSENNSLDRIQAYEAGIDDFYPVDVPADDLHERISLLKEIKSDQVKIAANHPMTVVNNRLITRKRVFDIMISLLLMIFFLPVMFLIALAVLIDSRGPILYLSKRVGTGYHIFDFYKFRTMKVGADKELYSLLHMNQYSENGSPSFVKINNDPRITKLGSFLRRSSLDELPQLFNVLKGDMSLVGNRPLPLYEAEKLTTDMWARRFLAPAGITGLWQVTKRGKAEMSEKERIALDVTYADRASFWFDLKILLKTVPALMQNALV